MGARKDSVRPGPQPDILIEPPLLVIEILSPDDTYSDLQERCQDYTAMGVDTIWIVDPKTRSGRMCRGAEWTSAETLAVADSPIHVVLDHLFRHLDVPASSIV
jgi:Uma2 family endonuclease